VQGVPEPSQGFSAALGGGLVAPLAPPILFGPPIVGPPIVGPPTVGPPIAGPPAADATRARARAIDHDFIREIVVPLRNGRKIKVRFRPVYIQVRLSCLGVQGDLCAAAHYI
jgi:hypothetical protein